MSTIWQKQIHISPKKRGFHLITDELRGQLPELSEVSQGLCHLFLQHTSASLCLNENTDPQVPQDMEMYFLETIPNKSYFTHTQEGDDDMPAHIKSALLGTSLLLPVNEGDFALGTWQGIFLGEHRKRAFQRHIFVSITASS